MLLLALACSYPEKGTKAALVYPFTFNNKITHMGYYAGCLVFFALAPDGVEQSGYRPPHTAYRSPGGESKRPPQGRPPIRDTARALSTLLWNR